MTELKRCPFCKDKLNPEHVVITYDSVEFYEHPKNGKCDLGGLGFREDWWNTRPIEDELNAKIAQLTAERDDWKQDAERLIQLANFNNKRASEYFDLHEQLVKKYEVRE